MMSNRYIRIAAGLIAVVSLLYVGNFYFRLGYVVSDSPEAWGQMGDYAGGVLNPLLSFISIVLLIKSLALQNDANSDLRDEIRNTRKTERLRSFEAQLFHMIESQRSLFDSLRLEISLNGESVERFGADAVIAIEDEITRIRDEFDLDQLGDDHIREFLNHVDNTDKIFGVTRIFYNIVKLITDKLSDDNGFEESDRAAHYVTLMNFSDFALLRLIMISVQFMDYHSVEYLKKNLEFSSVVKNMSLGYSLY
ncbi:hypothetical protein SAMN05660216_04589 [Pseudomonas sp. LAMO17WK12:I8]|uniref:hypothetical protein n=2 Tax=Pseudomonas TaxID=286 RepID=UPI000B70AB25|nr:hypothetical protein [Pseudomonas sp. LAMO17WK12:I11]SNT45816.1 hypothetical protein SAMN05660216_04589 [Pseudomonas sp. LAMO17WK12:I8]SNY37754.1 hypothetical protein SAMN05660893_04346 [Pseudomonas sp. LAMO17WK12:I12]SNY37761.1 hypothetical protein SAMN05660344_04413 [Pseudomonas sp. LAMO17WK12:I11]SNY39517.1 hypothetical protein SAMN05660700_04591 [Pseudomonas sp. LAMO17WK12:I7]